AVFKGGTAIRKFHAGVQGRFSTDLDFAVPDDDVAAHIIETLDGAHLDGFSFSVEQIVEYRRARLNIDNAALGGRPVIAARIDMQPRTPWLRPELLRPLHLAAHAFYDFEPQLTP